MTFLAVLLALGSAGCFGLSSALQQRAVKQERPARTFDPRILFHLLRRPLWLLGWLPDAVGTGLQAFALRFGPLALVQPLLVSGTFLAIPLEAALVRRRPRARDLATVALGVTGLAAFLSAADPRAGVEDPSALAWLGVGVGASALVAVCTLLSRRSRRRVRAVMLGIATGVLYAVAAALFKSVADRFHDEFANLLTDWRVYALVAIWITGLLLNQDAFQGGPLAASLTTIAVVDPVTSVVIAITAFHERLAGGGLRLGVQFAGIAMMAGGIWLASMRANRPDVT